MLKYKDYIYAVYQEQSFSKAAQKLYVSQPWLSSAVKKTERELKTPIFDRTTTPISLTQAGRYYIEQTERLMQIEEEMRRYFSELETEGRTELHIGSSMFFCTYVLPGLMEEFRELYPQTTLTFTEGDSPNLLEKLLNGKLDFILESETLQDPGFRRMSGPRKNCCWRCRLLPRSTTD